MCGPGGPAGCDQAPPVKKGRRGEGKQNSLLRQFRQAWSTSERVVPNALTSALVLKAVLPAAGKTK